MELPGRGVNFRGEKVRPQKGLAPAVAGEALKDKSRTLPENLQPTSTAKKEEPAWRTKGASGQS